METVSSSSDAKTLDEKSSVLSDLIAFYGPGEARWSGRDAPALTNNAYRRNVIAYRCVQMIAEAAASVPFQLKEGGLIAEDTALTTLLDQPHPDQSGPSFRETLYGHLQVFGNAYAEVVWRDDVPVAMYPLRPDRVKVQLSPDGWPAAYLYGQGKKARRIRREVDGKVCVVHIKLFHPLDDHYGQSPMQVAGDAVDLHNASTAWNKALLDNAARPSGALIYRGGEQGNHLTGAQFDRLKDELAATYQGQKNAGRPLVLDGGLDWRPMSLSPAEMDFKDLKNGAARDVALAFGVPPMLLGIPGDNTYSNYQQAVLAFWRHTILPVVEKVRSSLNAALVNAPLKLTTDLDQIDALIDSRTARLEAILDADFLTDQEKRAALGFPANPAGGAS